MLHLPCTTWDSFSFHLSLSMLHLSCIHFMMWDHFSLYIFPLVCFPCTHCLTWDYFSFHLSFSMLHLSCTHFMDWEYFTIICPLVCYTCLVHVKTQSHIHLRTSNAPKIKKIVCRCHSLGMHQNSLIICQELLHLSCTHFMECDYFSSHPSLGMPHLSCTHWDKFTHTLTHVQRTKNWFFFTPVTHTRRTAHALSDKK